MIIESWTQLKGFAGVIGAIAGGSLGAALGGWDMWLKVLVLFVVLDYISGLLAAFVEKKLNSEIGFKGVAKKVFIFIIVALAFSLEQLTGAEVLRQVVIGFYLGVEGLSILKNAGKTGLPLPKVLKDALEELKQRGEETQKEMKK